MAEQAVFNPPSASTGASTIVPLAEVPVFTPFRGQVTYYKMQATCSSSPSGYISWVNTTGNDQGRPACLGIVGPSVIAAQWSE